jgi:hypothetical protein
MINPSLFFHSCLVKRLVLILVMVCLFSFQGHSWLYPEHRDITLRAIRSLDESHRKILDHLWALVRNGNEQRLNISVADTLQGTSPVNLDYAAWPAVSGDHSCSPENLIEIVLHSDWILNVAAITARLKVGLANSKNSSEKDNNMRDADIKLLKTDPDYVSRAGKNNGHFKLALPDINTNAAEYMDLCRKTGTPLNVTGIYTWFHSSALEAASKFNTKGLTDSELTQVAFAMLADEAFALHFLEDCFASGHVAGIWGDASQRKGTHDFYNAIGYQVSTWAGERMVLMGDAYMRDMDEMRASISIKSSLEQVLDNIGIPAVPDQTLTESVVVKPDTFSVCMNATMPSRTFPPGSIGKCSKILINTPVPGLASGPGAMPRTSTELGPFIGIATAVNGSILSHGFSTYQETIGMVPGLEIALRLGLGLEGLLNESSDGLTFLDIGYRIDGPSTMKVATDSTLANLGSFGSAMPSRNAYFLRLRLPFYLIPGDLLILAPVLLFTNRNAMNKVIATAGNGGLIPWQSKMNTPIGSFQFILGREVGVSFYGTGATPDAFMIPWDEKGNGVITSIHSTQINFPILEYRLGRSYAARQSADFFMQLYGGIDIPGKRRNLYPENTPMPPLRNIYFVGLRFVFDYRHYLGKNK